MGSNHISENGVPDPRLRSSEFHELFQLVQTYWDRFQELSLADVESALKRTESELPRLIAGMEDKVYCRTVGADLTPEKFYLCWTAQLDRLNLINGKLQSMVTSGELSKLKSSLSESTESIRSLLGKAVVVPMGVLGTHARGFVSNVDCKSSRRNVRVFLYDYGDLIDEDLESLYELPLELSTVAPLCFRATLLSRASKMTFLPPVKKLFQDIMKQNASDALTCNIEAVHQDARSERVVAYHVEILVPIGPQGKVQPLSKYLLQVQEELEAQQECFEKASVDDIVKLFQHQYLNVEIDVREYSDLNLESLKKVKAVNVLSPSELYLQNVSNVIVPSWYMQMQVFYSRPEDSEKFRIKTSSVFEGRCYVWQDGKTKFWERVRVLEGGKVSAKLWLLDKGRIIVRGDVKDMMEMEPKFSVPALAFKAELIHVKPASKGAWPSDVNVYLRDLLCRKDAVFDAATLTVSEVTPETDTCVSPCRTVFGVVLAGESEPSTIQAKLVESQLAVADGPSCGCPELERLFASAPYSREALENEVGYTLRKSELFTKDPLSSLMKTRAGGCDRDYVPQRLSVRMGAVMISSVIGPGIFYVQLKRRAADLEEMMRDLKELADKLEPEKSQAVPGQVVLARVEQPIGKPFKAWEWARVVLYSVSSVGAKGIAVDFGSKHGVDLESVRPLPKYLTSLPPFCQRAHLDLLRSQNHLRIPADTWTTAADKSWRRYLSTWNLSKPQYYAWQIPEETEGLKGTSIVQLEEFNQPLRYDETMKTWFAVRARKLPQYACLSRNRDHPLLKHLFESVGVTVEYCDTTNTDQGVKFFPAWDVLQKMGFVVGECSDEKC